MSDAYSCTCSPEKNLRREKQLETEANFVDEIISGLESDSVFLSTKHKKAQLISDVALTSPPDRPTIVSEAACATFVECRKTVLFFCFNFKDLCGLTWNELGSVCTGEKKKNRQPKSKCTRELPHQSNVFSCAITQ